jgi:hypothetical protein
MNDLDELSPEARALLAAGREADGPSPDDRSRVKGALLASLAAGGATATTATAAAATTGAAATGAAAAGTAVSGGTAGVVGTGGLLGVSKAAATLLAGAVVTGAVVTGVVVGTVPPSPPPQEAPGPATAIEGAEDDRPLVVPPASPAPVARVAEEAAPEPAPAPAPEPRVLPRATPPTGSGGPATAGAEAPPAAPSRAPSTVAAELALLRSARAALRGDDGDRALAELAIHAARFPDGVLAQERDALRAEADCTTDRGVDRARRFLARHPRSVHAARLREVCRLSP